MKRVFISTLFVFLLGFACQAQSVSPSEVNVRLVEETVGTGSCSNTSNCEMNQGCFSVQVFINQTGWSLASYNVYLQYDWNPGLFVNNNANHLSDDACLTEYGTPNDDNDIAHWYRISGVNGGQTTAIDANTWTTFHNFCWEFRGDVSGQDLCVGDVGWNGAKSTMTFTDINVSNKAFNSSNIQKICTTLSRETYSCLAKAKAPFPIEPKTHNIESTNNINRQ